MKIDLSSTGFWQLLLSVKQLLLSHLRLQLSSSGSLVVAKGSCLRDDSSLRSSLLFNVQAGDSGEGERGRRLVTASLAVMTAGFVVVGDSFRGGVCWQTQLVGGPAARGRGDGRTSSPSHALVGSSAGTSASRSGVSVP